jgi:uncharacterized protein involved in exopolysaccharide biosynthesis
MQDTFTVVGADAPHTRVLMSWLDLDTASLEAAELREEAMHQYSQRLVTRVSSRSGIIEVGFRAPYPDLAAGVANRIVQQLTEYDLNIRRTSAASARKFLDSQVSTVAGAVQEANRDLEQFLVRNRNFASSPALMLEFQRLQRRAVRTEAQYEQLVLQRDRSRIDEVSSIPALSVVDSAAAPFRKSSPKRRLWVLLGLTLGGTAAAALIILAQLGGQTQPQGSPATHRAVLNGARAAARDVLSRI